MSEKQYSHWLVRMWHEDTLSLGVLVAICFFIWPIPIAILCWEIGRFILWMLSSSKAKAGARSEDDEYAPGTKKSKELQSERAKKELENEIAEIVGLGVPTDVMQDMIDAAHRDYKAKLRRIWR